MLLFFSVLPGFSHHMHTTEESQQETESLVEPTLPIPLHQLYEPRFQTLSDDKLQELCLTTAKNIKVTNEEAEFLQKVTIGQSDCTAWHEHRKGRLTASHFHVVCRHVDAASQVYPKSIVKRIMQYYSSAQNVPALKWGRDNEDRARNEYIKFTKGKHNNLAVRPSGLVIHPNYPLLGASPDGFVCCDCCESRVLEIKCPFKYRATSPTADKPLSDPNFCLQKNAKGDVHLSFSHPYYYQVQGQIALCNVKYCDFACWTEGGLFVEEIERNENLITDMIPKLEKFFTTRLLPELLTRRIEYELEAVESDKENQLYCVCRGPEYGKMIACDNAKCGVQWFHYKCVGLKRAPRGKWFCKTCT